MSRRLVERGPSASVLFAALLEASELGLSALETAGVVRRSPAPMARSAFLLANDLAQLVPHEQIAGVLGVDPLSRLGMVRWTDAVMAVYGGRIFATASGPA